MKAHFAAHRGHAERVAIAAHAFDHDAPGQGQQATMGRHERRQRDLRAERLAGMGRTIGEDGAKHRPLAHCQ